MNEDSYCEMIKMSKQGLQEYVRPLHEYAKEYLSLLRTNGKLSVSRLLTFFEVYPVSILLYHVRVDLWVGWWEIRNNPEVYSTITKATAWLSIPTHYRLRDTFIFNKWILYSLSKY